MITKFKIFESEKNYKDGDFILLDVKALHDEDYKTDGLAVIIEVNEKRTMFPYLVLLSNKETLFVEEEKIIRHLTEKEIEEFRIKFDAKKYNI
jgi:hypothetical protein